MDIKEDRITCGFFKKNDDGCLGGQCEFNPQAALEKSKAQSA